MRILFASILCVILQGCLSNRALHIGQDSQAVHALPITKQKQRIAFLQKKLELAEKNLRKAQDEVERLSSDLHHSQLSLIERQIENYEQQVRKLRSDPKLRWQGGHYGEESTLFLKERELLQQMMENGPSPSALDAQVILDRILRMITELKEIQESH